MFTLNTGVVQGQTQKHALWAGCSGEWRMGMKSATDIPGMAEGEEDSTGLHNLVE